MNILPDAQDSVPGSVQLFVQSHFSKPFPYILSTTAPLPLLSLSAPFILFYLFALHCLRTHIAHMHLIFLSDSYQNIRTLEELGAGANTCSLNYSGGWGRRITWAKEFEYNLGNIGKNVCVCVTWGLLVVSWWVPALRTVLKIEQRICICWMKECDDT
jgi:hypothetical protein